MATTNKIANGGLISRNAGNFTKSDMDVLSPEEFLAMLHLTE